MTPIGVAALARRKARRAAFAGEPGVHYPAMTSLGTNRIAYLAKKDRGAATSACFLLRKAGRAAG